MIKINKLLKSGKKLFREVQTGIDKDTRKPIIEKEKFLLKKSLLLLLL